MTLIEQAHAISAAPKGKAPKNPTKLPVPPRKPAHVAATASNDPFSIPPMLDRKVNGIKDNPKVVVAVSAKPRPTQAEENNAAFAEARAAEKKEKARVRVEKMLAKKSGDTAKMPLTGKAALQAIANAAVENGAKITKCQTGASGRDKAERAIDKKARKGTPAKKPAKTKPAVKGPTIGSTATAAILAGKTNEQALAAVMKAFPKCSSNLGCMSWYRNQLRKSGKLK